MKFRSTFFLIFALTATISSCTAQTKSTSTMATDSTQTNPLLCDIETGVCETPGNSTENKSLKAEVSGNKTIKVVYFTDPICSSCWGIEPQLRKLKLEYGDAIEIEYRMGGLLPDWNYNSGGISKPSDVAHHWDEVSIHYDMPIDGDVWLEDPLDSSYPPSVAFKAAQMQDEHKALLFMREMREMVFLEKKNIAKWEVMEEAAKQVGLDVKQLKTDFDGQAKVLFEEDLKVKASFGVRGFPTMFFIDDAGNKEMVYGSKAYAFYEMAILKMNPEVVKKEYPKNWEFLFEKYNTLTAKEFSVLSGKPRVAAEVFLNDLTTKGKLSKLTTKNGSIWEVK